MTAREQQTMPATERTFIRRMTLTYVAALAALALLAIAGYYLPQRELHLQQTGAAVIATANRQHTLLERAALLAECLAVAREPAARAQCRSELARAIALMEESHRVLLHGDAARNLPPRLPPAARAIFFDAPHFLDQRLHEFLATARELADADEAALIRDSPQIELMLREASGELADGFAAVAAEYQSEDEASAQRLLAQERWVLGTTLCVLVLTGVAVFRPMVRRAQQQMRALRQGEERLRLVIEGVRDYAIFLLDPEGRVASWNAGAQRIKGYRPEEILGSHFSRFYPPEDVAADKPRRALETAAAQGRWEDEGWRVRKDGSRFWANVVITALRDETDRLRGFVKITRDITERRHLEEAKLRAERLAAVGSMSAKLAHEIRNPLGSIRLNLDSVRDEVFAVCVSSAPPPDSLRSLLGSIDSEVRRIQRITDGYLQFARPPKAERERVSLHRVLSHGLGFLQGTFENAGVAVRTALDGAEPVVLADPGQLWQAFLNLIRNAIEAMPDGGALFVRTVAGNGCASVAITDTGRGMSDEVRQEIFKPFYSTKPGGTGLGLLLTQQIISEHGGRVDCQSVQGKGTTFTVTLPLAEEMPDENQSQYPAGG
jgi:PAS domain S-box-containing protein